MHPSIVMDAEKGQLWFHEPRRGEQLVHLKNILSLTQRRRGNEYGICIQTATEPETSLFVPLYQGIQRASYQQILEVDRVRTLIDIASQSARWRQKTAAGHDGVPSENGPDRTLRSGGGQPAVEGGQRHAEVLGHVTRWNAAG
jgi:hypothetical protein